MKTSIIAAAVFLIGAGSAAAQTAQQPSDGARGTVARACRADIQTHCKDVARGGGQIAQCLAAHRDKLTPACTQALQSAAAARQGSQPAPTK